MLCNNGPKRSAMCQISPAIQKWFLCGFRQRKLRRCIVAEQAGLTRAQWIKRCIRWQLWDRAGELRLAQASAQSILKLAVQVRAVGRSLNQAVKAVNAANRPESAVDIAQAARAVIEMEDRISAIINMATFDLSAIASGEVRYWMNQAQCAPKDKELGT